MRSCVRCSRNPLFPSISVLFDLPHSSRASSFTIAQMLLVEHVSDDGREGDGSDRRQPSVEGRGFGEQFEVRQSEQSRRGRFCRLRPILWHRHGVQDASQTPLACVGGKETGTPRCARFWIASIPSGTGSPPLLQGRRPGFETTNRKGIDRSRVGVYERVHKRWRRGRRWAQRRDAHVHVSLGRPGEMRRTNRGR